MNQDNVSDICAKSTQYKEVLRLVGDFWTLRIIAALESSDLRFCALERVLGDSNPATLAGRLKRLEAHGIIARRREKDDAAYTLTRRGAALVPIVQQIYAFAETQEVA